MNDTTGPQIDDVTRWRRFAVSTLLPVGLALLCASLPLLGAANGVLHVRDASASAAALGVFATLVASVIVGARAMLAAGTFRPRTIFRYVPAVVLWMVALAAVVALADFVRDHGEEVTLGSIALLAVSAFVTRRRRTFSFLRHVGVALGVAASVLLAASLVRHLNVPYDARPLVVGACFLAGVLAISSVPVRVLGVAAAAIAVLAWCGDQSLDVEKADDLVFLVVAVASVLLLGMRAALTSQRMGIGSAAGTVTSTAAPS
jgi:hypothetical protein